MEILPLKFEVSDDGSLYAETYGEENCYNIQECTDGKWNASYDAPESWNSTEKTFRTKELAIEWCNDHNEKTLKRIIRKLSKFTK